MATKKCFDTLNNKRCICSVCYTKHTQTYKTENKTIRQPAVFRKHCNS